MADTCKWTVVREPYVTGGENFWKAGCCDQIIHTKYHPASHARFCCHCGDRLETEPKNDTGIWTYKDANTPMSMA